MSKADDIRAKVRNRALGATPVSATSAPAEETRAPVKTAGGPRRGDSGRKVRRTVDLGPAHHRELSAWCDRAADELDVTRVTGQDVLSALVARLLTDDRLSDALIRDLRDNQ